MKKFLLFISFACFAVSLVSIAANSFGQEKKEVAKEVAAIQDGITVQENMAPGPKESEPPNWPLYQLVALAVMVIIWVLMRIIPTWSNNDVISWILDLLGMIVPNRKKAKDGKGNTWVELHGDTKLTQAINRRIRGKRRISCKSWNR